ncbi:MAG TPA: flippase [Candidatus Limnocylindrales bacterium]|nr:flippase [Candidatus Limnocylindrales bacterium]
MADASAAPGSEAGAGPLGEDAPTTVRGQIRGSTLLLVGRLATMAVNFVVQVAIVRYLTRGDYGAFAFALSIADLGQTVATFGLDRSISRFAAIDDEEGRTDRVFGTIFFATFTSLVIGLLVVGVVIALVAAGAISLDGGRSGLLVAVVILLAPIQALDTMFTALLSVFASPRAIFIRRFIVAPALRLGVVIALVALHADVVFLAAGYVVAGALGVAIYVLILGRVFAARGLWQRLRPRHLDIPARELLAFTIPLLTTDLVYIVLSTSDAILLGLFHGADDVAAFRVVIPAAGLNQLVFSAFTLLFVPAASRLFARRDTAGIRDLYWQTAIWMTVASFPLFALTFSLAEPLTVALYQARYASSAPFLAMLSLAYYMNTALGFNGLTLRVFGDLRYVVIVNVAAAVLNIVINVALIPPFGPAGAAVGTMTTLIVHNILKQLGLRRGTDVPVLAPAAIPVYAIVGAATVVLLAIELVVHPGLFVGLVLAGIVSAVVLLLNRHALLVADTFPEIARLPLVRRLFG